MPEGLPYYVDMANYSKTETSTDGTGVTAVDADGNPITLDEGAEAPMAEGVDEGAEGAEDAAAAAADEAAADAEGAAPAGDDAAVEQPAEGAAE